MRSFIISILSMLLLLSCSAVKRRYMKGFYFTKHVHTKNVSQKDPLILLIQKPEQKTEKELTASITVKEEGHISSAKKSPLAFKPLEACDTIILFGGTKVLGKIVEVNAEEIKTQGCDGGPPVNRTLARTEVHSIRYANGTKEEFAKIIHPAGKPTGEPKSTGPIQSKYTSGYSTAGFVLSLVSYLALIVALVFALLTWEVGILVVPCIVALLGYILSILGILHISNNKEKRKGMAFSIIGIILSLPILFIFPGALLSSAAFMAIGGTTGFAAASRLWTIIIFIFLALLATLMTLINWIIQKNKKQLNGNKTGRGV